MCTARAERGDCTVFVSVFVGTVLEKHAEYFAAAAQDPYCMPPPIEQIMRSLGITVRR